MLENLLQLFSGKKTYFLGLAIVAWGIYQKDMAIVLEGLALMGIRAGVAKLDKKKPNA